MITNTALTLALGLALLTGSRALAQDEVAAPTDGPLWLVSCSSQANPDQLSCDVSQSLVVPQGNQRLATASFGRIAGQDQNRAYLTVPYGVALAEAVAVAVDDVAQASLPYDSCDAQGCHASGAVDEGWMAAMRQGERLTLTVRDLDGRDVALTFRLQGFARAQDLMP